MKNEKRAFWGIAAIILALSLIYFEFFHLDADHRRCLVWTDMSAEEAIKECPSLVYTDETHRWMLEILETAINCNLEDGIYNLEDFDSSYSPLDGAANSFVEIVNFEINELHDVPRCSCGVKYFFEEDNQEVQIEYGIYGLETIPIEVLGEYSSVEFYRHPNNGSTDHFPDVCYSVDHTESICKKGEMRHEWFWLIKREIQSFLYR